MAKNHLIQHAFSVIGESLSGDHFLIAKIKEHRRVIELLCAHIESQDARVGELEVQVKRFVDKLIDKV